MSDIIPVKEITTTDGVKRIFEEVVGKDVLEAYRLPVSNQQCKVIVGLSGGADSTVLALFSAIYLVPHYPNLEFVFTDTKAEPDSCYQTLDNIEAVTGIPVTRLTPKLGLFEKIDDYNGFLPGNRARWCTKELKIKPLLEYLSNINTDAGYISLAGIRYDEINRDGIQFQHSMENEAKAAYPFIDLKITKNMVFSILGKTVGIPSTYLYRSRSGCFSCFFQRNAEIVGMLFNDPRSFELSEAKEKLTNSDKERWSTMPETFSEIGIRSFYPVPAFIDIRKPQNAPEKQPEKVKLRKQSPVADLFEAETVQRPRQDIYVAYALYVDEMLSLFGGEQFTPGVYHQEFITFSTSIQGLKASLANYYKHKVTTPMPQYDVDDMKIVIAQLRFSDEDIDTRPPEKKSYTWKSKVAYLQLRHIVNHCQAVLEYADLKRQVNDLLNTAKNGIDNRAVADAYEQLEIIKAQAGKVSKPPGELIWEGIYTPNKRTEQEVQLMLEGVSVDTDIKKSKSGIEFDDVPAACIACSV